MGRLENLARPEGAGRLENGRRPESVAQAEAVRQPDATARPDVAGQPDATARPDFAGRPDGAAKPGVAGRSDGEPTGRWAAPDEAGPLSGNPRFGRSEPAPDPLTGPPPDSAGRRTGSLPDSAGRRAGPPAGPPPSWLELLRREAAGAEPPRPAVPRQPDSRTAEQPQVVPPVARQAPQAEDGDVPRGETRAADAATVLTAVRELPGVRGAELVGEPGRQQVLRLDLVATVDPNVVGRQAAALLRDQLGVQAVVRARTDAEARPHGRRRDDDAPAEISGPFEKAAPAVTVEQVQVVTVGLEAAVEVGLAAAGVRVAGRASGPAHDWHVLRAAVTATVEALGMLLAGRARLALEYAELVSAGPSRVAVVSLLLIWRAGTERVAGAAPVLGESPDAAVAATIAAVRHRLPELLDDAAIGR